MTEKYPKSEGVLFKNNDKTMEKHPDMRGHIEVSKEQVKMLIEMAKAGQEPKLQIAGWKRKSKGGMAYIFLSAEAYMKREEPKPAEDDFDLDEDVPF